MEYYIVAFKVCLVFFMSFLYLKNSGTTETESRSYRSTLL